MDATQRVLTLRGALDLWMREHKAQEWEILATCRYVYGLRRRERVLARCGALGTCMRAECSLCPKKARTEENLSEESAALLTPAATGFEICLTARKKSLYTSTIRVGWAEAQSATLGPEVEPRATGK